MRLLPSLARTHPNFFFIYAATAAFHLAIGYQQMSAPERYTSASFAKVIEVAPMASWGFAHLCVFGLLLVGAYSAFTVGRVGLAAGLFLCLSRGLLLEAADAPAGSSLVIFLLIAALHYSQAAEPPVNPLTNRG